MPAKPTAFFAFIVFLALLCLGPAAFAAEDTPPSAAANPAPAATPKKVIVPVCGNNQFVQQEGDDLTCKDVPSCGKNERLIFLEGIYSCVTVPTCDKGQSLSFNGKAYICSAGVSQCGPNQYMGEKNTCSDLPTCTRTQQMTYISNRYVCLDRPACDKDEQVAFNGTKYVCKPKDQTECPPDEYQTPDSKCAKQPLCDPLKQQLAYVKGRYKCLDVPKCLPGEGLSFDGIVYKCRSASDECKNGEYIDARGKCVKTIECAVTQIKTMVNGRYVCLDVPKCLQGEYLTFDGTNYVCKPGAQSCRQGEYPKYGSNDRVTCLKTPDCSPSQSLMFVDGDYVCLDMPRCGAGQGISFTGTAFVCQSPPK